MADYKRPTILGNIRSILALPCAPDPSLWVASAVPAALEAIYDVLDPDPKEAFHWIAGKSALCAIKEHIKAHGILPPEETSFGTRFLYKAAEWADRELWWVFLADIAGHALINWTSNVIEFGCPNRTPNPLQGSGGPWFGGLDKDGSFQGADFTMNAGSSYYPATASTVHIGPKQSGYVAASASWTRAHPLGGAGGSMYLGPSSPDPMADDPDIGNTVSSRVFNSTSGIVLDQSSSPMGPLSSDRSAAWRKYTNHSATTGQLIHVQWSYPSNQKQPGTSALLHDGHCSLGLFARP